MNLTKEFSPVRQSFGHVREPLRRVREPFKAAGIFFAITCLLFWPFFFQGQVIAPTDILLDYPPWNIVKPEGYAAKNVERSDIVDQYLPALKFFQDRLKNGEIPLWNPLGAHGSPFLPLINFALLSPFTLAFLPFFDLATAFSFITVAKLFAMGFFMYLFLKKLELDFWPAVTGGAVYMLAGFNVVWLFWPHTMVMAFAPLLFLAIENLVRKPGLPWTIATALAVAMMMFAGFPAVAGYMFYASGLYFLVRVAQTWRKTRKKAVILKLSGFFLLSFLLGLGLATIQILPTLEFLQFVDIGYREELATLSFPAEAMIRLLFPYGGGRVFPGGWIGNVNETTGYIGIIPLVLLIAAIVQGIRKKQSMPVFFAILALMALMAVYGIGPLLRIIHYLPVFNSSQNTRLLSLFGFSGAIAAAYGARFMLPGAREKRRDKKTGLLRRAAPAVLFLVITADLALFASYQNPPTDRNYFYPSTPGIEFLTARMKPHEREMAFDNAFLIPGTQMYYGISSPLIHHFYSSRHKQLVQKFAAVYETPTAALPTLKKTDFASPIIDLLGIKYLVFRPENDLFSAEAESEAVKQRYTQVYDGNDLSIFENSDYETGAFLVKKVTVKTNPDELLAALSDYDFNPQEQAFVEEEIDSGPPAGPGSSPPGLMRGNLQSQPLSNLQSQPRGKAGTVAITEYGANSVTYETHAPAAAFLATTELMYPGWKAFIDDREQKIYGTNYIFRGVPVPAGKHEIRFIYEPQSFWTGAAVSGYVFFLIIIVSAYGLARSSNQKTK